MAPVQGIEKIKDNSNYRFQSNVCIEDFYQG